LSQQLFFNKLEAFAENVAYIDEKGNSFSYHDLTRISDALVLDLESRELVLCVASNSSDFLTGYFGFLRKSLVPLLLSSQSNPSQIQNYIDVYSPTYIFIPKGILTLPDNFQKVTHHGEYELFCNSNNFSKLHDDLALLMTTSGSTGNSKLVRLSFDNLQSNTDSIVEYMGLDFKSRAITTLPFNYSYGLSIINTHLCVGGSIILNDHSLTEAAFWERYDKFSASHIGGVPFTYEMLYRFKEKLFGNKSLKTLTQAGGRLPANTVKYFANECNDRSINFYVMYGQTEATARMSYLDCLNAMHRPHSIGKPIPGGKFLITGENGDEIDAVGLEGEIVYEGRNVALGYATKKSDLILGSEFNGRLNTGDLGVRDELGFYYIKGRSSRIAKINGIRINLQELEDFLSIYALTFGVVSDDTKIYIFYEGDVDKEDLVQEIASHLRLRPTSLVLKELNSLPRTISGKIDIGSLSQWI